MEGKVVTCSYVFTKQEYRRAMRAFWFGTTGGMVLLLILPAFLGCVAAVQVYIDLNTPWRPGQPSPVWAASNDVGSLIFALVFVMALVWFGSTWTFSRGVLFNSPMNFALSDESCHLRSSMLDTTLQWLALRRWKGTKNGFLVFIKGGRSFYWLPFDGFKSPDDVAWMRDLLTRRSQK